MHPLNPGWPQAWKTWKPGKLRAFEKLSESQGNLDFCRKNLENSGKIKNMWHDC